MTLIRFNIFGQDKYLLIQLRYLSRLAVVDPNETIYSSKYKKVIPVLCTYNRRKNTIDRKDISTLIVVENRYQVLVVTPISSITSRLYSTPSLDINTCRELE